MFLDLFSAGLGNITYIDQERKDSVTSDKISAGRQFEEMCTCHIKEDKHSLPDGTGSFTAVRHEFSSPQLAGGKLTVICFGEVDCKDGNDYVELKCTSSAPMYVLFLKPPYPFQALAS